MKKALPEDDMDSFFVFLEIVIKKEKKELYDQLFKDCNFFKETVEILNNEVKQAYEDVYA